MRKLKGKFIKLSQTERLHQCPYPLIAITGGIGTGKSLACQFIKDQNYWVISADDLVHQIYLRNETIEFIKKLIPEALEETGINFKKLRTHFFSRPDLKEKIELYIYSWLPTYFKQALPSHEVNVVFYEVPLLFEKNLQKYFDYIVMISTDPATQLERACQRDGNSIKEIENILKNQLDLKIKEKQSDHVIHNTKGPEYLKREIESFLSSLLQIE